MSGTTKFRGRSWLEPETLVQSVGIAILLTVLARLAGFGRGVVFARSMSRAELGTWALANNAIALLSFLVVLGLPGALSRYVERFRSAGQLRAFVIRTAAICLGGGTIVCVGGILMAGPLAEFVFADAGQVTLLVLTLLTTLALVAFNVLQGVLQGLRVSRVNSLMQVAQAAGFAAMGGLVLTCWRSDAVGGMIAYFVTLLAVTAVPGWLLVRSLRAESAVAPGEPPATWRQIFAYSLGTWGAGGLMELWRVIDRWMLVHTDTLATAQSLEQIGSYHIVEMLTLPLLSLAVLLSILLLPHVVHLWEAGRDAEACGMVQLATKLVVLGALLGAAALVVLKEFVLAAIFGDTSRESRQILEPVLATIVFVAANFVVRSYLLCRERAWSVAATWLAGLCLNCLLNLLLIPWLHLQGAVIATMWSAALSTGLVLWLSHRDGLKLDGSCSAITALPLVLLAPPLVLLAALGVLAVLTTTTEVVLSREEKRRINAALARTAVGRAWLPQGAPL